METLTQLAITDILPNPYQPRLEFSRKQLEELAASIREHGIIQPIIVRKSAVVGYELLAGERRLRASQLAGLTHIPAIIKELSDEELLYQAIIENLQRSDLNPIEEALAYQNLIAKKSMTHDDIAKEMGKSRPYITNSLRLLNLSEKTKQALIAQTITPGHARLLLSLDKTQESFWLQTILTRGLTVKQLHEQLKQKTTRTVKRKTMFIKEQETQLKKVLGLNSKIQMAASGKGQLTIQFSCLDDFHTLINNLIKSVEK